MDQILELELSKWYRTLKAIQTNLIIKKNILKYVLFYKYWLLGTWKIGARSSPMPDLLN